MGVSLVVWLADGEQEQVEIATQADYEARWLPLARRLELPLLTSLGEGDVVEFDHLEALAAELARVAAEAGASGLRERATEVRERVSRALAAEVVDAFVG